MGSQQFCLRWNNHQTNMLSVFDQLLASGDFVDVTLACDGGVSIKAHKMVLSACSPYFQNLFKENPCRHPIVILKDMRYAELRAIVDFMYKGEINVSQDQLSTLLKTAESLKVKGLAEVSGGGGGVAPNGGGGSGGEAGADASQLDEPGPSSSGGHGKHGPGGVGSPGLDGNASPHSRRKRHRPARRPSNSDNSNTELPSGSGVEQRLAADPHEVLTIPKSEPVDLLGKSQVEMMMETESHYQMDMALSERTRSQDPLDRDSSLGAHSDGHLAELSQPSTSGTQPSSQASHVVASATVPSHIAGAPYDDDDEGHHHHAYLWHHHKYVHLFTEDAEMGTAAVGVSDDGSFAIPFAALPVEFLRDCELGVRPSISSRRETVRILCAAIFKYDARPRRGLLRQVAAQLVERYPAVLGDAEPAVGDGEAAGGSNGSLLRQIVKRIENINQGRAKNINFV